MCSKVIFLGLFLAVFFLFCTEAPFVKMTNVVCDSYNKSWTVFHYCRLKAYSRNKTSLHINATFLHPANNISLRLKMMKRANGYKPFLFDFTIDACQFLRRRNNPVIKMFHNLIRDVSTLNHSCPYGLQVVSDFHRVELPVPFPSGDYVVLLDFIFDGKTQFFVNIYSHLVEDF
ncbi:uncharacterized protein LOC108051821 isoform X2 [Drosophila rhopaloa]|uniref:Uncharacterized protein LOC108051821 isoform X2 n=1 Tax=Drosophila rhopaloa TaxID=1041015 RepID=A0A6P4FGI3_DRORH|nr:uncharacterized protein LOC108051821 isoform X2 [Drosophila rhopaloa]